MTTNELFDVVAPIAIYGGADWNSSRKPKPLGGGFVSWILRNGNDMAARHHPLTS